MKKTKEFYEGYNAAIHEEPVKNNPYKTTTKQQKRDWVLGWYHATQLQIEERIFNAAHKNK